MNLGLVYEGLNDHNLALKYYRDGLDIAKKIGDLSAEGAALSCIGNTLVNLKDYETALTPLNEALEICSRIGNLTVEAETLNSLANLYYGLGNFEYALEYCNCALNIATELSIPLVQYCQKLKKKLLNEQPEINDIKPV